jgi:hypothetical protein
MFWLITNHKNYIGPALVSGSEIAAEASSALGVQMKFEDISQ